MSDGETDSSVDLQARDCSQHGVASTDPAPQTRVHLQPPHKSRSISQNRAEADSVTDKLLKIMKRKPQATPGSPRSSSSNLLETPCSTPSPISRSYASRRRCAELAERKRLAEIKASRAEVLAMPRSKRNVLSSNIGQRSAGADGKGRNAQGRGASPSSPQRLTPAKIGLASKFVGGHGPSRETAVKGKWRQRQDVGKSFGSKSLVQDCVDKTIAEVASVHRREYEAVEKPNDDGGQRGVSRQQSDVASAWSMHDALGDNGAGGKGKSSPPPPTKSAKGGSKGKACQPRKPDVHPKVPIRKLFWDSFRVSEDVEAGNVWLAIDKELPKIDTDALEGRFGEKTGQAVGRAFEESQGSAVRKIRILSEQRRKQICILLARLPPVYKTCAAIVDMDYPLIGDYLELLLLALPAPEEIKVLQRARTDYTIDESNVWDTAESFIFALLDVPACKIRLQIMCFLSSFDERVRDLCVMHQQFILGCDCMLTSARIRHLLGVVLAVGNYLNGGTPRGRADGFSAESLLMLRMLRTTSGSSSLLDFVLEMMEENYPGELEEICREDGDLCLITRASASKSLELTDQLEHIASVSRSITSAARGVCESETLAFTQHCETMAMCSAELDALMLRNNISMERCVALSAWLLLNASTPHAACDTLFGIWATFAKEIMEVRRALAKPRRERRKQHIKAKSWSHVTTTKPSRVVGRKRVRFMTLPSVAHRMAITGAFPMTRCRTIATAQADPIGVRERQLPVATSKTLGAKADDRSGKGFADWLPVARVPISFVQASSTAEGNGDLAGSFCAAEG